MNIAVFGYGNLGKSVARTVLLQKDQSLVGIFTRRDPRAVETGGLAPVYASGEVLRFRDRIDVMINCGGSLSDLPVTSPYLSHHFNLVDAFDTHAKMTEHYNAVNEASLSGKKTALIAAGWDPGLFSVQRILATAFLTSGKSVTLWGPGVSQGHSDALRRIAGVKYATEYTVPLTEKAEELLARGVATSERETHERLCFIVQEKDANEKEIERKIMNLPYYFKGYETKVKFVSEEEYLSEHTRLPHGGSVLSVGDSPEGKQRMKLSLELASNPDFTANILVASARAVFRFYRQGSIGAKTPADVPPAYYLVETAETLISSYV